jgi:hypothetical protein
MQILIQPQYEFIIIARVYFTAKHVSRETTEVNYHHQQWQVRYIKARPTVGIRVLTKK